MTIHLEYPSDIGAIDTLHDGTINVMQFTTYERSDVSTSTILNNIYMYMPLEVQNTTSINWEQGSIGAAGLAINKGLSLKDDWGNAYTGLSSAFLSSVERLKQTLTGTLSGGIGQAQNAGEFIGKKVLNPYIKVLFKGVDYRNFTYSFIFTPHTEKESQTISDIIKAFRASSVPDKTQYDLFLEYPNEFEIAFFTIQDGVMDENPWINKIKRVVLNSVTVNHSSTGTFSTMRNGFPSHTQLDLNFVENEHVYRSDIQNEGY